MGIVENYAFPVRKAIAEDITNLKLTGKIDREGIYLKLDAVGESISHLSMEPVRMNLVKPETAPENIDQTSWERFIQNFKGALSRLTKAVFRVQYHERPIEPLMTLEQQQTVQITLGLVLEQAKVALLRKQPEVFAHSLGKAQHILNENSNPSEELTAVISILGELSQQPIVQSLPDGTHSLKALKQYLENRQQDEANGREG